MPPTGGKKKTGPKAHKLAEQFPKGLVLRDLFKKEWVLGDVVGKGGFGLIYLATLKDSASKSKAEHVIKIEPKNNGPLFCEMTFYQRIGKKDQMQDFTSRNKLQYLPVPPYISSGMTEYKSAEYRFLTMPRYGTDLQKLLDECGGIFPAKVVFSVGLRMIDALQYLHESEYVHADIKAANILQGYQKTDQVYLVDYGLAYRYTVDGNHKVYKEDPRKAHDGTIEFTSRDAHKGVFPSRRADLEILGYCLLQWLCGKLPWENKLSDPVYVAGCKEKFFQSVSKSVASCFSDGANPNSLYSDTIIKFLDVVKALKYDDIPSYNKLRDLLKAGLKREGQTNEWRIDFVCNTKTAKALKRKSGDATFTSPLKKSKASPEKKPRKKASPKKPTPKKKIITPMTPKSPATKSPSTKSQPRKPPAQRNGSPSKKKSKPSPKKSPSKALKLLKKRHTHGLSIST